MNGNGCKGAKPKQNGKRVRTQQPNGNSMAGTAVSYAGAASNQRPVINGLHTMRGSDFFSTIEVKPDVSGVGRIIAKVPISPSQFPGTRLTQLADLWEFFKFTKFSLRWVPAVPTTLACQFVLYMDLDPSDDPTGIADEDALIRQAVAQTGAQQWNFHVPKTIPLAMRSDRQYYFTGSDKQNVRFTQQGAAYLIQITNPINFNGETLTSPIQAGSLFIDWVVNFSTPQINPGAVVVSSLNAVAVDRRITNASLDDLEVGINVYDIAGFTPRRYYAVSLSATMDVTGAFGSLQLFDPRTETMFCNLRSTATDASVNFYNSAPLPGFYVAQADDTGSLSAEINMTGITPSDLQGVDLIFMPIFEEAPLSLPPRARRSALKSSS